MTAAAVVVLVGATILVGAGGTPAEFQHRHRCPLFVAIVVGLALVAGGAAVWLGGWA